MLKQLPGVAQQTDYAALKAELLPRMHSLCLKTTSASVRVNSLTCMAKVAARLDEDEAAKMLQTAAKVGLLLLTWCSDPRAIVLMSSKLWLLLWSCIPSAHCSSAFSIVCGGCHCRCLQWAEVR